MWCCLFTITCYTVYLRSHAVLSTVACGDVYLWSHLVLSTVTCGSVYLQLCMALSTVTCGSLFTVTYSAVHSHMWDCLSTVTYGAVHLLSSAAPSLHGRMWHVYSNSWISVGLIHVINSSPSVNNVTSTAIQPCLNKQCQVIPRLGMSHGTLIRSDATLV